MGGVLVFRMGVRARRVVFFRESWVSGALLVFDDDVRFYTPDPRDLGSGIIDYFQWPEVVGVEARNRVVGGVVQIVLQRGEQRFRCLDAVRLAERLKRVHAACHGEAGRPAVAPDPSEARLGELQRTPRLA